MLLLLGLLACASAAAAEPAKPRSLFDGKSLGDWKIVDDFEFKRHGKIEVKDETIALGAGTPGSCIRYAGKLPTMNYEIALEAMRVEGDDFFCGMTFMIGEQPLTLIVGGWGGQTCGLSCIDGEPAAENETCDFKEFENNRWYKIRLRVTEPKVEVWIDDGKLVDFERGEKQLSIWFEKECVAPLSIATWRTAAAVRNICLTELTETK
jgi:hypothetical protein